MSDGYYAGGGGYYFMPENYPEPKPKKQDTIGLADAITKSILSAGLDRGIGTNYIIFAYIMCVVFASASLLKNISGRIDLHRKLFCSMQLVSSIFTLAIIISSFGHVGAYMTEFSR